MNPHAIEQMQILGSRVDGDLISTQEKSRAESTAKATLASCADGGPCPWIKKEDAPPPPPSSDRPYFLYAAVAVAAVAAIVVMRRR